MSYISSNYTTKKRPSTWVNPEHEQYVVLENISKSYGDVQTVKDISLSVNKGELFTLLGGSGCGKTTLLRILAGFEKPTSGRILVDGIDITNLPAYKRPVNLMFQSYALFPHMNVYQNIAFGLKNDKLSKSVINDRVKEVLNLVQLSGFEDRNTDQLSGGQKQRIALARSIAKRPKLLLLDEPLAALDKKLREQTQFELVNIQEMVGITFIMVTHDQEEAMTVSSRMGIMEDGRIKQIGIPHDIYEFPNSKYVAKFIGDINLFEGIITESNMDYVIIESNEVNDCIFYAAHTGAIPINSSVTLAIRPEKIMISKTKPVYDNNCTSGIVREIAYLGDISIYHIELNSGKIVRATLPNLLRMSERTIEWEDMVYIFWRSENSIVLTS
ncbi:MAG: ABC transporter ATP-binding protein [Holosporales bacterium]|nr:ABC transporter ATP-binding protein [Holosporales bacterium]